MDLITRQAPNKLTRVWMILPGWFDSLEENFSFKTFCPHVKTSCHPAETVNENPLVFLALLITTEKFQEACHTLLAGGPGLIPRSLPVLLTKKTMCIQYNFN